jgi:hypothetical protein
MFSEKFHMFPPSMHMENFLCEMDSSLLEQLFHS